MSTKRYLLGLLGAAPKSQRSHNGGYARTICELLDLDFEPDLSVYNDPDAVVYIYHGIAWSDGQGVNVFGGLSDKAFDRLTALANSKCKLYSIDGEMPDLGEMVRKRIGNKSTYEAFDEILASKLTPKCNEVKSVFVGELDLQHTIIGDSHAVSMRPSDAGIIRLDSKTLHGALSAGTVYDNISTNTKKVTLMFGSVDIRHHLMRFKKPLVKLDELLDQYQELVHNLQSKGIEVEVCSPVPVEFEGRKIPGTGEYKGTKFFGTQAERNTLTFKFIDRIKTFGCDVVTYPSNWYTMDSEEYAKSFMERPQSVHVALEFYRTRGDLYEEN